MSEQNRFTLLPQDSAAIDGLSATMPSLTYGLDRRSGHIRRRIDGADALQQSIYKRLLTEAAVFPIYSEGYGLRFLDLVAQERGVIESELRRRIEETLLRDDRIAAVADFSFVREGEALVAGFRVTAKDGATAAIEGRIEGLS